MISRAGSKRTGFSLIELLVVIGVIAILVSLLFPAFRGMMDKSKTQQDSSNAAALGTAIQNFRAENGYSPGEERSSGVKLRPDVTAEKETIITDYLLSTGTLNPTHKTYWEK